MSHNLLRYLCTPDFRSVSKNRDENPPIHFGGILNRKVCACARFFDKRPKNWCIMLINWGGLGGGGGGGGGIPTSKKFS